MTQSMVSYELEAQPGFTGTALEELVEKKNEPDWLRQRRLDAWRLYEELPMPARTDEAWRRTDISSLKLQSLLPYSTAANPAAAQSELPQYERSILEREAEGEKAGVVVQRDSLGLFTSLDASLVKKGVICTSLDRAVRDYPELVREYLATKALTAASGKFQALNAAFWSGGVFLYVPAGVEVALPFYGLVTAHTGLSSVCSRTLIVAEPNSSVTYIDEYVSPSLEEQIFHNGAVEIIAHQGAQVHYINLQQWGRNVWNWLAERAVVQRDANVTSLFVALGARLTKADIEARLEEAGANAQLWSLVFGDQSQHFDFHTLQDHLGPQTFSDLLFKAALKDQGRSIFAGLIRIQKPAQGANAYQESRNLLLSEKAKADSIPSLEILANDVRCKHGATVGQIDESQLFYLMSRGLRQEEAERMIVQGFFEPIIERVPLEGVRNKLRASVERKLLGPTV